MLLLILDTIYTERYMGLPTEEDNLYGYLKSSVFRKEIDTFNVHDLLLIHGTADDNVHYQNSLLFAKKLQAANILFEEMVGSLLWSPVSLTEIGNFSLYSHFSPTPMKITRLAAFYLMSTIQLTTFSSVA